MKSSRQFLLSVLMMSPTWVIAVFGVGLSLAEPISLRPSEEPVFCPEPVARSGEEKLHAATHPVIPGFERFFTAPGTEMNTGGRLLLGELNCTSCHKPNAAQQSLFLPRPAPVLDRIGERVQPGYLRKFLLDPQAVKPGTVMPNVLAGLSEEERLQRAEELAHFLASTGTPGQERLQPKLVNMGRDLYRKVGCVACHGSRDAAGKQEKLASTSVPLGDLTKKYTPVSLAGFLENPLQVRPGGRMPGLLNGKEAQEVAHYLLQGLPSAQLLVNVSYAYYEGNWGTLPDLAKLKPVATGQASGFDKDVTLRPEHFALKFEGYFKVVTDGNYKFWLTSDDGSKLWVNGQLVVNNDGVHAAQTQNASTRLEKGIHKVTVGMFNAGGPYELKVEVQGPGLKKQRLDQLVTLTPEGNPKPVNPTPVEDQAFPVKPELAARGRAAFASLGCGSCHQFKDGKGSLESTLKAPAPEQLRPEEGCLSGKPGKGVPHYPLSERQRKALQAALAGIRSDAGKKTTPNDIIRRNMITLNCYACHVRDKFGGVEETWNPHFLTTQPEMGDEGRLPPDLTGVGAKLRPEALKNILANGGIYRPYMHTRMPRFGEAHTSALAEAFLAVDRIEPLAEVKFSEAPAKVKAAARHMVGGLSLGCIKCHTFAGQKAEGVQGIDLLLMAPRLNRDWFHRYLIDPSKYRPGTRMPSSWPQGQTLLPTILDGNTSKQIEAIWVYLSDPKGAGMPVGLGKKFLPLTPDSEAIIYRNFVAGGGPRAIAVGYPEKAHLVFDANEMRYAMFWQGGFIDAARHWTDRGVGFEPPLGDNILKLPGGVSFSFLSTEKDAWPTQSAKALGYRFLGYRTTPDHRPTFLYSLNGVKIEDFPTAVATPPPPPLPKGSGGGWLKRTITLTAPPGKEVEPLYFRAAVASKIESAGNGIYRIDGEWSLAIEATTPALMRRSAGKTELIVPVRFRDGRATIVQQFVW